MKSLSAILLFFILILNLDITFAQCGNVTNCNSNTGIFSNDNAADIAYDNMGSSFHSTYIKEPNNIWKVWGEDLANDGVGDVSSPITFDGLNYPALTGTIYKMALGSSSINDVQLIVLTSTGLFVLGDEGAVLDLSMTNSSTFQKIVVNGKTDGLPVGVSPSDIKMMFASAGLLMITTCNGNVYTLSQSDVVRGNGGLGNATQWGRVMQNVATPLTNVIAARGTSLAGFALKSDGTLWTWGFNTYLGNGTAATDRSYATLMTLPAGMTGIKMIQATPDSTNFNFQVSYYILGTDKKVYSLGNNSYGQLGDNTSIERTSWVNAKSPNNAIITDAGWISTNEHDDQNPGIALLKTNGVIYTAGNNSLYMIGRNNNFGTNYLNIPSGITNSDIITFAETGGHTCALIKQCYSKYGYVGHLIDGSMGNGTFNSDIITTYDFTTPPAITVCGAQYVQPIVTNNGAICPGQNAVFNVSGAVGDTLSYTINNGSTQTVVIGSSGTAQVVVTNATTDQTINFTHILGANSACSYDISVTQTITLNGVALFTQVPPICQGQTLNPLPLLSTNGIQGTWSPALNNQQTTQYTFTPSTSTCVQVTMTIVVNPATSTPVFTPVNSICEGENLNPLPTISNNAIAGSWSPPLNNLQTTVYTFTPTNTSGSCVTSAQLTIVVDPKVTPNFNQVPAICEGTTLANLPVTSNNSITGSWSPTINNLQTTQYIFTPNVGSCAKNVSMTIVVNPKLTPTFPVFSSLCYADSQFVLPLVSNNGIPGTWSPSFNNTQTTTYVFTPNTGECALPASNQVVVYNDFDFKVDTFCSNKNFLAQITPTDFDATNATINWNYNSTTVNSGSVFDVTNFFNSNSFSAELPLTFSVTVTNSNLCTKTKILTIENIFCDIPNAISPNNDSANDSFDLSLLKVKQILIYNRWGVKVYDKDNYLDEWHGQTNSGKILPDGVYFYVLEFPSGASKTGWVFVKN